MAMFAALAYGVTFVFRIPVSFLTFDAKDAVLTVAAFIYGPLASVIMALIPALIELIIPSFMHQRQKRVKSLLPKNLPAAAVWALDFLPACSETE